MKLSYRKKNYLYGYLFVLLPLIGTAVLYVYPLLMSLFNSFFQWNAINPRYFIGLENYEWMFTKDRQVLISFKATLTYLAFHVPLVIGFGLFFALILNNKRLRGLWMARTAIITPLVTAPVAVAAIWLYVFNPNVGLLNTIILEWFGGEKINWFSKPAHAMFVVMVVSIWRGMGYSFIFLFAGLQSIPTEFYEAAALDGASGAQRMRRITLPLLTPTIFLVLVLVFIGAAQEFELPLLLTGGGPRFATSLVNLTIYRIAFQYGEMGYASSVATITFFFLLGVTAFQFVMQKKWVNYME